MPRTTLDHDQVRRAHNHGLPPKLIAERLGCTPKSVNRILRKFGHQNRSHNPLVGAELEWTIWNHYKEMYGYSYRELGYCFCLSHEHIRTTLNEKTSTPIQKEETA